MNKDKLLAALRGIRNQVKGSPHPWDQRAEDKLDVLITRLKEEPEPKVLAEGWAGPMRFRTRSGALGELTYETHIPVHLDRCPKDGRPVAIIAREVKP